MIYRFIRFFLGVTSKKCFFLFLNLSLPYSFFNDQETPRVYRSSRKHIIVCKLIVFFNLFFFVCVFILGGGCGEIVFVGKSWSD